VAGEIEDVTARGQAARDDLADAIGRSARSRAVCLSLDDGPQQCGDRKRTKRGCSEQRRAGIDIGGFEISVV
jgi:hypothetical protein